MAGIRKAARLGAALAASLALAFLTMAASAAPARTGEVNKEIIRAAYARWAAGGTRFFDEVLAPDVEWTIEGSGPVAGVYCGREDFLRRAVAPFARALASPVRPEVGAIWADGDHVIVQWRGTAVTKRGTPYRNSYVWIFRMSAGRAVAVTAYLDLPAYYSVLEEAGRR